MRLFALLFAVSFVCGASAADWPDDLLDLKGKVTADFANAYLTRAKVVEDRPVEINSVRLDAGLWKFGRMGFWHWDYSSLTGRRQHEHRRFMEETIWGAYWSYSWKIAKDWSLENELMPAWHVYFGGRPTTQTRDFEWRFRQSLENPYVTPFWFWRNEESPYHGNYFDVGIRHRFRICSWMDITPALDCELGDGTFVAYRYDAAPNPDLMALNVSLTFDFPVTEWLTISAQVKQFEIMSQDGRENCTGCNHADFTYFQVGAVLSF